LITVRRNCALFHPDCLQEILTSEEHIFAFKRYHLSTGKSVYCFSNLTSRQTELKLPKIAFNKTSDLITGIQAGTSDRMQLNAYQTIWLAEMNMP
jgi:hypothetical protein